MNFLPSPLPGVIVIEPKVFGDERGFFFEVFHAERFADAGIRDVFLQDNHSRSSRGVLRGLHYQLPNPQGKLVRAVTGAIWDVAVDIRRGSPHFGKWFGIELSEENKKQLWVPPGFAHGFSVLSDSADVVYKCTTLYDAKGDRGVRWNDPTIGIEWPITAPPQLSTKDATAPLLGDADLPAYP
ncbi:MAG: dTDP-4-dehydrorhamnose 3,5-epimerase [Thermoanaerobaculia bacterium]